MGNERNKPQVINNGPGGDQRPQRSNLENLLHNNMGIEPTSVVYTINSEQIQASMQRYFEKNGIKDVDISISVVRKNLDVVAVFRTDDPVLAGGKKFNHNASILLEDFEHQGLSISMNAEFSKVIERFLPRGDRRDREKALYILENHPEYCYVNLSAESVLRYCLAAFSGLIIDIVDYVSVGKDSIVMKINKARETVSSKPSIRELLNNR